MWHPWWQDHPREWWNRFRTVLCRDLIKRAYNNGLTSGYNRGWNEAQEGLQREYEAGNIADVDMQKEIYRDGLRDGSRYG